MIIVLGRALIGLILTSSAALALDCSGLQPSAPVNVDTSVSGKFDAQLSGLIKSFAGVKSDVDGTYRKVAQPMLQQFPEANRLYMWERVLYIQCQIIADANDLKSREKMALVGGLYQKDFDKPPQTESSNSLINNGDNNLNIQGSNNAVTQH